MLHERTDPGAQNENEDGIDCTRTTEQNGEQIKHREVP